MAETTVVNWGFVIGTDNKEMMKFNVKAFSLNTDIVQQFVKGPQRVTVGEQDESLKPVYLFGQRDPNGSKQLIISSRLTYIAQDLSFVTTASGSKYFLSGEYVNAKAEESELRAFGIIK